MKKGAFVVFEGPNGGGKTTLLQSVCDQLAAEAIQHHATKEPTLSELGIFIRKSQNVHSKEVLACLVAANRYEHIKTVVKPYTEKGYVVLSDRYFPSSLVYQRMDELDTHFIQGLNQKIIKPDLTVFLVASVDVISERIGQRDQISRFEQNQSEELQLYNDAIGIVKGMGWHVVTLDTGLVKNSELVSIIVNEIKKIV